IINSYSTGGVSGAMYAGGIVGRLEPFSSVQGCYSTGFVEARNSISLMTGNEHFAYAYAGGIVGYVYYDAIVSDCFSISGTDAYAAADSSGRKYSFTGDIAGGINMGGAEDASVSIETNPALVLNCYSKKDNINKDLILNRLGWHAEDWTFIDGDEFPVINKSADGVKRFTFKINLGSEKFNNSSEINVDIDSVYLPVSFWYSRTGCTDAYGYINAESGHRSFGLYFDAKLTEKVPNGYIPINAITLYAGFADYGDVAGEYYFTSKDGGYIALDANGGLIYSDGALKHSSYYSYDGTVITLYDTFIGIAFDNDNAYRSFKATFNNGVLTVYDNDKHPQANGISAVKAVETFNYGSYYNGSTVYTFNKNGTGSVVAASQTVNFTYEMTAGGLTVKAGAETITCTVDANGNVTKYGSSNITPFDKFLGVWEKSAGSKKQYSFDGKGNYTVKT
ncbi:MAG: hypothetical protein K2K28_00655, partial [Clostridia bacterium]|nr:hypothetical protein [Clostridia bacterium]